MPFAVRVLPLACSVLASCGLGNSVAERFLVPRSEWLAEPSDLGLPFEEVELATGAGTTVHGWFVPAAGNDGRTVLRPEKTRDGAVDALDAML